MSLKAIIGAYGLSISLHVLGILLINERWVVIEFFNTFAHLIWLPTLILVPICLIFKQWRLAGLMLPGLIALIFIWGDMFIPKTIASPPDNAIQMTIMSYNLSVGQFQLDDEQRVINEIDPDVIVLQEVFQQYIEPLTALFEVRYPYLSFHPNGTGGQGVLSKYPIVEDEYWQYDFLPYPLGHQRVMLQLDNGQSLVIYNEHPTHPGLANGFFDTSLRHRELLDVLDRASQEREPVILMGDFNMSDFSRDYRMVTETYTDAFRQAGYGLGWTFPRLGATDTTILRLDYIFLGTGIHAQSVSVWRDDLGSDHQPIYADIFWIPSED